MGKIIEEMEIKLRNSLQEIYFGKTRDITNALRSIRSLSEAAKQNQLQAELLKGLKRNVQN
jgi:capping protein beta